MKRLLVGALLVLLVAAAGGVVVTWGWSTAQTPFQGYGESEKTIDIAPGATARAIVSRLVSEGVLAHELVARAYLRWEGNPPLQAGEYLFSGPMTTPEVFAKLRRGDVLLHQVTVVEGLTLEETAAHLAAAGFGDEDGFLSAMRQPTPVLDLDPDAVDLEGYLFPDSYRFPRGTDEATIVAIMVETFRQRFEQAMESADDDDERSPREILVLASIVEKEARLDDERPVIAGVYRNRLDRGIALYADPTIIFALKRAGTWDGNLRRPDLAYDSPYNTYLYPGLPPGPICSPGAASLSAAAAPADVPYFYFVSRNDGSHVFATTLAEHNRNVDRWQKRYWRERWARERGDS